MKRLISAVTSTALGLSVMSSAFVGSFSTYAVSEANNSFAAQSVITANGKATANKNASSDSLQWTIPTVNASEAGSDGIIWLDITVTRAWGSDPATEGVRGFAAALDYDESAFELVEIGESDYGTVSANPAECLISATPNSQKDEGIILSEGKLVTYIGLKKKANVADGFYPVTWKTNDTFAILDPGSFGGVNDRPVKYADLDLIDGGIQVGSGKIETTPKTTTTKKQPTTPTTDKLQWTIGSETASVDTKETIWLDVTVSNAWGSDAATEGIRGVAAGFKFDTSAFELVEVDKESCYGTLSNNKAAGLVSITPASDKDEGIIAKKGDGICYLGFNVKSGAKAGTYDVSWDTKETFGILDPGSFGGVNDRPVKYADLSLVDGAITLTDGTVPQETTPKTTTKKDPSTPVTDKLQWSIANESASVNTDETIWLDVTVSNAWGSDAATEGIRGVAAGFKFDTSAFELVEVDKESCYGTLSNNKAAGLVSITPASDEDEGIIAKKGDGICYLGFNVKSGAKAGTYDISWDTKETFGILDPGSFGGVNDRPVKYADLDLVDGSITLTDGSSTSLDPVYKDTDLQWTLDTLSISKETGIIWVAAKVSKAWGSDASTDGVFGFTAALDYDKTALELVEIDNGSCYGNITANVKNDMASVISDKGVIAKSGDEVVVFGFKLKDPSTAGSYAIKWDKTKTQVVLDPGSFSGKNDRPITYANVDLVDGSINNSIGAETTTTPGGSVTPPTTTTTAPVQPQAGNIEWVIPNVSVNAGETAKLEVKVKGSDLAVAGYEGGISFENAGSKIALSKVTGGDAYGAQMLVNNADALAFSTSSGLAQKAENGSTVFTLEFKVDENCASGTYAVDWGKAMIIDDEYASLLNNIKLTNGSITVHNNGTLSDDEIAWIIPDVSAAPGETVKMQVKVKGENVAVSGYEGGITVADSANKIAMGKLTSGDAYGELMLVNNGDSLAFSTPSGLSKKAADGSTIFTVEFKIDANCPAGKYPVKWDNTVSIIDEEYNSLLKNVVLTNGSITVTSKTPSSQTGNIEWVIPTTNAKPGDTVKMAVKVKGEGVSVSGFEGGISFNDASKNITYNGITKGDAYGADMIVNGLDKLAFATPSGLSTAAAYGSTIFTIEFKVGENCTSGVYYVSWNPSLIMDENYADLGANVSLVSGAIIVDDGKAATTPTISDNEIGWIIPDVTVNAGETATLDVVVKNEGVAVSGFEGGIAFADANGKIKFSKAVSGDAYGADLLVNGIDKLAFSTPSGLKRIAEDGSKVFTLTFDVAADCAEGTYPVAWGKTYIIDEDYNIVPVTLVNGSIKVINKNVTTTPTSGTTTPGSETTPTSETTPVSSSTETIPVSGSTETTPVSGSTETTPVSGSTETTPVSGSTETTPVSQTTPTSETTPVVTTTKPVIPEGSIGWIIPTQVARPGDKVTLKVYVMGEKLSVAGFEGGINWTNPLSLSAISSKSEAYDSDVVYNPEKNLVAFARDKETDGQYGVIAKDNSTVFELTFTVPENCPTGTYPITWGDNVLAIDADYNALPITYIDGAIVVIPGSETTTTVTTPVSGSTETTPVSGSTETTPVSGSTETTPVSGSTETTPVSGSTETTPVSGSTETTPVSGSTETTPVSGSTETTPVSGSTETTPVSGSTETTPVSGSTETTPVSQTTPISGTTVTTPVIPSGSIGWVIPTQVATPGEKVTLKVYVSGEGLAVAGFEGGFNWKSPIEFSAISNKSEAYDSDVVYNPEYNLVAFGRDKETNNEYGVNAKDKSTVFEITFTVPSDCPTGTYPIEWADNAMAIDAEFNVLPITFIDGAIIVIPGQPTTSTTTPISMPTGSDTTPVSGVTETTPVSGSTETTPVSQTTPTSETTPVSGSTETTPVSQTTPTSETTPVSETTPTSETTPVSQTTPTSETTPVSETTPTSETTPVSQTTPTSETTPVSQTTSKVTTPTSGVVRPGTDFDPGKVQDAVAVEIETTYGMYFSHDTSSFNKNQVVKAIMLVTYNDGSQEFWDLADYIDFNGATPNATFTVDKGNFYDVPVYFNGDAVGTVPALIGVKGDADLNNIVDASDASSVLAYYASRQTGGKDNLYNDQKLTDGTAEKLTSQLAAYGITGDTILEELAAFLADVDADSADNWKTLKAERKIDASDASYILGYYALTQTGSPKNAETWNNVLGK